MKTLLAALLITLCFNALADDNIIQQQLKLQQNLMRIQQQNQQSLTPERHEERREKNQQPYYNPHYYGNGGHEGGNFGSNSRHYSRGLGYYGSFYNAPYVYLPPVPQPQTNYWYYCQDPEGFYPNVNVCPDGWQQIAPNYRYYCQDPEGYYPDVDVCPDGWQQVAPQPDED